jgi:hypothetical protein
VNASSCPALAGRARPSTARPSMANQTFSGNDLTQGRVHRVGPR